jgi:RimJ/RimL family protein N-acetyltransferase
MVSMRGRSVGLRPLNRPDFPLLYEWRSELAALPSWTLGFRRIVRFEEFVQETDAWLRDAVTMIVVDLESGAAAGFARAYHLNTVDGYAYVMGYAAEPYRLRRHTAEATALFGRYLFEQFPLRKICSEVFEFNEQAIRLNRKLGFRDAGRLRQHVWWRDRYWDLLQFELFREDFDEAMRRFSFLNSVEAEAERVIVRNGHG